MEKLHQRLSKMMLLLSSNHDGEIIAAVHAIDRVLKENNLDWHYLADRIVSVRKLTDTTKKYTSDEYPSLPEEFGTWSELVDFVYNRKDLLMMKEARFVTDIYFKPKFRMNPTPKQSSWLLSLYKKVKA